MKYLAAALTLSIPSCAHIDYNSVERGTFTGAAIVVWVGPGDKDVLGDGQFLYVPVTGNELTFVRPDSSNPSGDSHIIRPEAFYTDGGSIPRSVQAVRGFNAWGYGPAYVIHDWLFVAKKCLNDAGTSGDLITDEMRKISEMTFAESARVMSETIHSLVKEYDIGWGDEFSGPIITGVTAGPLTHKLWTETGKCTQQQVTDPEHLKIIADLQTRAPTFKTRTMPDMEYRILREPEYLIVGAYRFD
ncbi:MAG: hypothetical protein ACJAX2_002189 [Celeribacter sp.]|jgi:hypothetical protein